MTDIWRLLLNPGLPGYRQMAIDEALYESAHPEARPVLRFYTWEHPTLSLGYFQDYKRVVCEPFLMHNKIDVVRRITGGRSVLHQYEVTYAMVAPLKNVFEDQSLQETYQLIAQALNLGLQQLGLERPSISFQSPFIPAHSQESGSVSRQDPGLPQCFVSVSKYEISEHTRKVIGSAQKRSKDRFLQHGSILLDFDAALQQGCVNHPDPAIEKKIAPLNRSLGRNLSFEEVVAQFTSAFERRLNVGFELSDLAPFETERLQALDTKYQSAEWTRERCR